MSEPNAAEAPSLRGGLPAGGTPSTQRATVRVRAGAAPVQGTDAVRQDSCQDKDKARRQQAPQLAKSYSNEHLDQWIQQATQVQARGFVRRNSDPKSTPGVSSLGQPIRENASKPKSGALAVHEWKRLPLAPLPKPALTPLGAGSSEEDFLKTLDRLRPSSRSAKDTAGRVLHRLSPLPPQLRMSHNQVAPEPSALPTPSSFSDPRLASPATTPVVTSAVQVKAARTDSNEDTMLNVLSTAQTVTKDSDREKLREEHLDREIEKLCGTTEVKTTEVKTLDTCHASGPQSPNLFSPGGQSHRSHKTNASSFSHVARAKAKRRVRKSHEVSLILKGDGIEWPDPKKYNAKTEFCLTLHNPVRRAAIKAIEWPMWDKGVLFLILLNTCQLALYNPIVRGNALLAPVATGHWASNMEDVFDVTGLIFSGIFAVECLVKITALGFFFGHKSYLSETFNYLDFFIVVLGVLDFVPSDEEGDNLSALRALRVMRPLRAVSKFPELKFIVTLILQCIPKLASVLQICLFIFFVFGILGVQLFAGVLRRRCFDLDTGLGGEDLCGGMSSCGTPGPGPGGPGCLPLGASLGRNAITFDHIGGAITGIFQTMTQEGWADIMYALQDTLTGWAWVYFIVLIVLGPWLALNLFLVVISTQYDENAEKLRRENEHKQQEAEELELARLAQLEIAVAECAECGGEGCLKCDPNAELVNRSPVAAGGNFGFFGGARKLGVVPAAPPRPKVRKEIFVRRPAQSSASQGISLSGSSFGAHPGNTAPASGSSASWFISRYPSLNGAQVLRAMVVAGRKIRGEGSKVGRSTTKLNLNDAFMRDARHDASRVRAPPARERRVVSFAEPVRPQVMVHGANFGQEGASNGAANGSPANGSPSQTHAVIEAPSSFKRRTNQVAPAPLDGAAPLASPGARSVFSDDSEEPWQRTVGMSKDKSWLGWQMWKLRLFAKSEKLVNIVLVFICLNTLTMLMDINCDHCDSSVIHCPTYKVTLEFLNFFFSFIFFIEMIIKLVGLGIYKYGTSPSNVFDFVIVIISLVDILMTDSTTGEFTGGIATVRCYLLPRPQNQCHHYYLDCEGGAASMSVLRAFRMVRIVKLLRALPGVQAQVKVLSDTASATAWLLLLIVLFLFIFLVLGMNLFGGILEAEWDPEAVALGAYVYVQFPRADKARYGRVVGMDFANRSSTPWLVGIQYTDGNSPNVAALRKELDLFEQETAGDWAVWTATADDATVGVAKIIGLPPRFNFDSFRLSMFSAVQLITAEGWNDNLYDIVGSSDIMNGFFLFALIVCGNWILFSLFIGILITNMNQKRDEEFRDNLVLMSKRLLEQLGDLRENGLGRRVESIFMSIDKDGSGEIDTYEFGEALKVLGIVLNPKQLQSVVSQYDTDGSGSIDFDEFLEMIKGLLHEARIKQEEGILDDSDSLAAMEQLEAIKEEHRIGRAASATSVPATPGSSLKSVGRTSSKPSIGRTGSRGSLVSESEDEAPQKSESELSSERACCCLGQENGFRRLNTVIAFHPYFEQFILVCIGVSTICLGIDRPAWGADSPVRQMLDIVDLFLNFAFLAECVTKIIAMSFWEYIKISWNKLDFLIVTTSMLDLLIPAIMLLAGSDNEGGGLAVLRIFRIFRIFRALRPLRIIAKAKGLQVLVKTFLSAVGPACNTFGIALGVFIILGCVGMQLFAGKLYRCSDPTVQLWFAGPVLSLSGQDLHSWDTGCSGVDGDGIERQWFNYDVDFDNIIQAVRAMIVLTTQDNWPGHLLAAIDSRSKTQIPVVDNAWVLTFIFFFVSIIVCAMVVINMVVGVFVDCYNNQQQAVGRTDPPPLKSMMKAPVREPSGGIRAHVYRVISLQNFDMMIAFFIVMNVFAMAVDSFKASSAQQGFDVVANYFFSFVFGVECILKLWTLRMQQYFKNGWNKFDFFIVMISFIGIIIDNLDGLVVIDPVVLRILRIFRIFRILRAFRIFKALKGLSALVQTIINALPNMGNLVAFLMLFFFIWGVLGVQLYGNMCKAGDESLDQPLRSTRCLLMDSESLLPMQAHFQTVEWTLITLFRVSTGDAWGDVMGALQLASGSRAARIENDVWEYFTALFDGVEPSALVEGLTRDSDGNRVQLAALALGAWNRTVTSITPIENADSVAEAFVAGARLALPSCISADEAESLAKLGVMDCRVEYQGKLYAAECLGTCGGMNQPFVANFYLMLFFTVSCIILLQLVIAVLMDQFTQSEEEDSLGLPHCAELSAKSFDRIKRRWVRNAKSKLQAQGRYQPQLHDPAVY